MKPLEPVHTASLFPALHEELIHLLRGLDADDWLHPTAAGAWRVRDIAAHLLDGDLRKLSLVRDGAAPPEPERAIADYADLVAYLNRLNQEWVRAARRLSPRVLIRLLDVTGAEVSAFVAGLDPGSPALHPVAWAGESVSPNWFDTGREYTERWHHQQQIRDAVGAPGLTAARWLRPVLELSVRALPVAYRDVAAEPGTAVCVTVEGEPGGEWSLVREAGEWRIYEGEAPDCAARLTLDADTAWRLLFNGLPEAAVTSRIRVTGSRGLALPAFRARAVMV